MSLRIYDWNRFFAIVRRNGMYHSTQEMRAEILDTILYVLFIWQGGARQYHIWYGIFCPHAVNRGV